MAQASLQQDGCSYKEKLHRSIGPGVYMLATPANDCNATCAQDVPADPYMRWQNYGPGFCAPGAPVDDSSELLGLNYKASKCAANAYLPGKYNAQGICTAKGANTNPRACAPPTEDTRLSNPPCTLRSTGWNRWEWLCWNPQDRAIIPFQWNTSYRIVAKDNHVPVLPEVQDASNEIPADSAFNPSQQTHNWTPPAGCGAAAPGNPQNPTYQSCASIRNL